jgi:hypothetical protein
MFSQDFRDFIQSLDTHAVRYLIVGGYAVVFHGSRATLTNRIDLLVSLLGVDFETCYATRVETVMDGTAVNFIDLENLKKNKLATGRLQDLADLENLTSGRRKHGRRVKDRKSRHQGQNG